MDNKRQLDEPIFKAVAATPRAHAIGTGLDTLGATAWTTQAQAQAIVGVVASAYGCGGFVIAYVAHSLLYNNMGLW